MRGLKLRKKALKLNFFLILLFRAFVAVLILIRGFIWCPFHCSLPPSIQQRKSVHVRNSRNALINSRPQSSFSSYAKLLVKGPTPSMKRWIGSAAVLAVSRVSTIGLSSISQWRCALPATEDVSCPLCLDTNGLLPLKTMAHCTLDKMLTTIFYNDTQFNRTLLRKDVQCKVVSWTDCIVLNPVRDFNHRHLFTVNVDKCIIEHFSVGAISRKNMASHFSYHVRTYSLKNLLNSLSRSTLILLYTLQRKVLELSNSTKSSNITKRCYLQQHM